MTRASRLNAPFPVCFMLLGVVKIGRSLFLPDIESARCSKNLCGPVVSAIFARWLAVIFENHIYQITGKTGSQLTASTASYFRRLVPAAKQSR
jgi:hypothetical protein